MNQEYSNIENLKYGRDVGELLKGARQSYKELEEVILIANGSKTLSEQLPKTYGWLVYGMNSRTSNITNETFLQITYNDNVLFEDPLNLKNCNVVTNTTWMSRPAFRFALPYYFEAGSSLKLDYSTVGAAGVTINITLDIIKIFDDRVLSQMLNYLNNQSL